MYMIYMSLGTVFIMSLGFEIAYKEIWLGGEGGVGLGEAIHYVIEEGRLPGGSAAEEEEEEEPLEGYPVAINGTHLVPLVSALSIYEYIFVKELSNTLVVLSSCLVCFSLHLFV